MKLESPVIDLEPHEWRRAGQWFFPSWPPWNWRPFVFLYVLLPGLAAASIADFLRYLGF
jgi:hypothetical protein